MKGVSDGGLGKERGKRGRRDEERRGRLLEAAQVEPVKLIIGVN